MQFRPLEHCWNIFCKIVNYYYSTTIALCKVQRRDTIHGNGKWTFKSEHKKGGGPGQLGKRVGGGCIERRARGGEGRRRGGGVKHSLYYKPPNIFLTILKETFESNSNF